MENIDIKVDVTIRRGFEPIDHYSKAISLVESMATEVFQSIDFPSFNADGFTRYLCTPPDIIKYIVKNRDKVLNLISKTITELLMEAMSKNDMENGYGK